MRDAAIIEIGIREIATFCEYADLAHGCIDKRGGGDAVETFSHIHSFLAHCGMVARLLGSRELAEHAGGRTLAEILDVPTACRSEDDGARELLDRYDLRLARGLAHRGEVGKILDSNIGDRDAFEDDEALFMRHYDPSVDTLTLMEEELNIGHIAVELADVKARAETWLAANATLQTRPATPSIPLSNR